MFKTFVSLFDSGHPDVLVVTRQ